MMNQLQIGDCIAYDPNIFGDALTFDDLLKMVGQKVILETEWDDEMELIDIAYAEVAEIVETNGIWIKYDNRNRDGEMQKLYREDMAHKAFREYARVWAIRELAPETTVIVSEEYTKAVTLTRHIIANAQAMQQSLYEVCKGLKEMRDGKLYKELGYQNFEDYCENEVGFTRRQTYNYISIAENLSSDFVKSISQIGSTKLALLAKLDEADREELTQRVNPQETSVKELKAEIQKLKTEKEQLETAKRSKHQEWLNAMDEITTLTVQKSKLEEQVQELESRPVDMHSEKDAQKIKQLKEELEAVTEERDLKEKARLMLLHKWQESKGAEKALQKELDKLKAKPPETVTTEDTSRIEELKSKIEDLKQQLAEKPAIQESLSGSDGEFDAYFRMFDDALKHMTTYLFRKDCTDFSRKQSISMIETKFESYISALKEERK